jgi:hypothetical protein
LAVGVVGGFVFEDEEVDELGGVIDFLPGGVEAAAGLVFANVAHEVVDGVLDAVDGLGADLVVGGLVDRHGGLLGRRSFKRVV